MDYRITTILVGIIVAISGLAFAFSVQNWPTYGRIDWDFRIISMIFPNLISGVIIAVGGIIVAIIGNFYFKKQKD